MARSPAPYWLLSALAIALLAAACGGAGSSSSSSSEPPAERGPVALPQIESSPSEDVPSALDNPHDESFPDPLVDLSEIRSGGPPPDGIPPVDEPRFLRPDDVDFLADDEPVLAFEVDGDARAYPVQILIWHEIVNDTVAGLPVTVSYCPLCNSAIAYDRRLDDRVLDFGTSGQLYQSALVMYDRQTESLWSHFTAQAIVGVLTGAKLDVLPVATVAWQDWREAHPDGWVLSRETGHERAYGRNPYPGYDQVGSQPFLFDGPVDGRLPAMARIVGVHRGEAAVGVRWEALAEARVLDVEVGGEPVTVWLKPGTTSALDSEAIDEGRDVGAVGVFEPSVEGRRLTFGPEGEFFRDRETGSTWNILGQAIAGTLEGATLQPVEHVDTFWFAWAAFRPETAVVPEL